MWNDVSVSDEFYRHVIEAERIKIEGKPLFSGIVYNVFENGYSRITQNFITSANQSVFVLSDYTYNVDNPPYVFINGVQTRSFTATGSTITLSSGLSAGLNVLIYTLGIPKKSLNTETFVATANQYEFQLSYVNSSTLGYIKVYLNNVETDDFNLYTSTLSLSSAVTQGTIVKVIYQGQESIDYYNRPTNSPDVYYPDYFIHMYTFDKENGESLVINNKVLKRVSHNIDPSIINLDTKEVQSKIFDLLGYDTDKYLMVGNQLVIPYNYNKYPVHFTHSYPYGGLNLVKTETYYPYSNNVSYTDRFFPEVTMFRWEFFLLLYKISKSFYSRFSENSIYHNSENERNITDYADIRSKEQVMTILNEKFIDGCYVIPLYSDNSIKTNENITRAEAVTYLNRFIEWSIERFR